MTLVSVELQDVVCADTEDVTGADDFYLVGAVSGSDVTKGLVTVPVSVNDGETRPFGDGGGVVFSADLAASETLKIALLAYDEDSSKDWAQYGEWAQRVGDAVGTGLSQVPWPWLKVAGTMIPYAVKAVGTIMSLDQDDKLGTYAADEPVAGLQLGDNARQWSFQGQWGPWAWWSGWEYTVRYTIHLG
jgi:hypothetical protein